jgi:predicted ester cyclase
MMAEGDKVWAGVSASQRLVGEWHGLPATGKTFSSSGVGFCRIANGKIVELSSLFDGLNQVQQLGGRVVPAAQ